MAIDESGIGVSDLVQAELVECAPDVSTAADLAVTVQETQIAGTDSPTQQAATATLTQTGADPPPDGDW
jgi:hypothetical protein